MVGSVANTNALRIQYCSSRELTFLPNGKRHTTRTIHYPNTINRCIKWIQNPVSLTLVRVRVPPLVLCQAMTVGDNQRLTCCYSKVLAVLGPRPFPPTRCQAMTASDMQSQELVQAGGQAYSEGAVA